jgi:hypothetical protein
MNGSMTVGPKPRPSSRKNWLLVLVAAIALLVVATPTASQATTLPPGNSAQQWNTIAQDTVVNTPGIFQNEALLYMAYVQAAVYDAVASIQGGYQPEYCSTCGSLGRRRRGGGRIPDADLLLSGAGSDARFLLRGGPRPPGVAGSGNARERSEVSKALYYRYE